MTVRFTTILEGLEVVMGLGIHPEELAAPQRVIVSVRMEVAYPDAAPAEDRIDAVLDYDFVRSGVQALVADRHFHLQETLCEAIAALCLSDARVEQVTVRTSKPDVSIRMQRSGAKWCGDGPLFEPDPRLRSINLAILQPLQALWGLWRQRVLEQILMPGPRWGPK